MSNLALIGYTGSVGSYLDKNFKFTHRYNRNNINTIGDTEFDLIVCAAPTGNVSLINNNTITSNNQPAYSQEFEMILFMLDHVRKAKIKKFFYVTSVYVADNPNTKYSVNRKFIEYWAIKNVPSYYLCRKSTQEEVLEDLRKFINE